MSLKKRSLKFRTTRQINKHRLTTQLGSHHKTYSGTYIGRKVISIIVYFSLIHGFLKAFENVDACKNLYGKKLKIFMLIRRKLRHTLNAFL